MAMFGIQQCCNFIQRKVFAVTKLKLERKIADILAECFSYHQGKSVKV